MHLLRTRRLRPIATSPTVVAVAALVFVAGGLGQTLHLGAVSHQVCPEHGELLHVPPGSRGSTLQGEGLLPSITAAAEGRSHGHDHCDLCVLPRDGAGLAPVVARSGLWLAGHRRAEPPAARDRGTARYRLAPKGSPPAPAIA